MSPLPAESPVRVACIQMAPRVGALHDNIADSVARIDAAAAQGATLMVLPELTSSGYVFANRDEAFDFNQILRDRRTDHCDAMLGTGVKPGWH